jgi:GT2 family glycosyltransferase
VPSIAQDTPTAESTADSALVDIITPVYGSPNLLMGAIASILLHPTNIPWHWWIIDDFTPEELDRALLIDIYKEASKDPRIDVLLNQKNLGFAGSNNAAAQQGSAPYILMLNSDVRVTDTWLQPMVEEMETHFKTGVVGAKLLFFPEVHEPFRDGVDPRPAGRVQHAGVAFNILRQPFHIQIGWRRDNPRLNKRKSIQAVTGAALLTRRNLWEKTGGLELVYDKGNFEDVEYCLRVKDMGFEVVYRPDVVIYHYAGGSGNSMTAMRNSQIFHMRCSNVVMPDEHKIY